jgi:NAD(P)-dependent dehydrogenase (short-subunit alcohol dehydrogenase family)
MGDPKAPVQEISYMPAHFLSRASARLPERSAVVALAFAIVLLALPAARAAATVQDISRYQESGAKRTVLVTGANRGLGLEFAKQYRIAGWNVIGTARDPGAAKELKALGVRVEELDVAVPSSVEALAERLKDQPIDLLINNAGVSSVEAKSLKDVDLDEYERVMRVNAIGPVRVTQALLPSLRAGKGKQVVGISSQLGSIEGNTFGGFYAYRESKAALVMFQRTLAADLKDEGFVCIAMSPGWVKTDMGGPDAPLTPEESIRGMRKVIDGLKPEDAGKHWLYDGTLVPW